MKGWNGLFKFTFLLFLFTFVLSGCSHGDDMPAGHHSNGMNKHEQAANGQDQVTAQDHAKQNRILTGNEFTITAKEVTWQIDGQRSIPVWTFNGSVPGPEIRVKQGEKVKITLKNELPEPVTIHWHGVPVPNDMDGIPGVTMNAVQPGESFTYEFKADVPGTYWYHSHQDSVNQVDKGLYGAFIVEADEKNKPERDYTLVLDEWMSGVGENGEENMDDTGHGNMGMNESSSMDHHGMKTSDAHDMHHMAMGGHDMAMTYDLFTINGKSGALVEPLKVREGERVRIRLINAGFMSHKIHLHGHEFAITAVDGQPVNDPAVLKDQLISIAPGERYDIEFTANNPGQWYLEEHGEAKGTPGMKAVIQYEGSGQKRDKTNETAVLPVVDMTSYGKQAKGFFTLDQKYDVEYTMNLGTVMGHGGMVYTINGKTFPETEPIDVKKGDLVKVKLVNTSMKDDHPMHLHGHFFQVLSKNGQPIKGAPLIKDTLNLKPGEEYVVAFQADNPGNWMFHCHDLHHASAGMVTEVKYKDYKTDFVPDPKAGNKPE
ncbi:multicopper oxidase family protein [Bacillaceae bacterium]